MKNLDYVILGLAMAFFSMTGCKSRSAASSGLETVHKITISKQISKENLAILKKDGGEYLCDKRRITFPRPPSTLKIDYYYAFSTKGSGTIWQIDAADQKMEEMPGGGMVSADPAVHNGEKYLFFITPGAIEYKFHLNITTGKLEDITLSTGFGTADKKFVSCEKLK